MDEKFSDISIANISFNNKSDGTYRVFKNKTEYIDIEASTAHEAIVKSAIANPYKVVKIVVDLFDFVDVDMLKKNEEEK